MKRTQKNAYYDKILFYENKKKEMEKRLKENALKRGIKITKENKKEVCEDFKKYLKERNNGNKS